MQKIHLYDRILSPLLTEKSTNLSEQNKIIFKVPSKANKKNLKTNIEKIFKVNVIKINIVNSILFFKSVAWENVPGARVSLDIYYFFKIFNLQPIFSIFDWACLVM